MTVTMAISPMSSLVFHSTVVWGMNAQGFSDFLLQTRLNLDPEEHVIFIYDRAPALRYPTNRGPNSDIKMLPSYSPFLSVVEGAIRCLKAVIKADVSVPQI